MHTISRIRTIGLVTILTLIAQAVPGALFTFRIDNAGTTSGPPTDDSQSFQQL